MQEQFEPAKQALDVISFGTAIGALAGWLPALAALFTIIWTGLRIYESKTVQKLLNRRQP